MDGLSIAAEDRVSILDAHGKNGVTNKRNKSPRVT